MGCIPMLFRRRSKFTGVDNHDLIRRHGHGIKEKIYNDDKYCCLTVREYSWDDIVRVTMNFSRLIGSGGFSTVYLAELPTLNPRVGAVKIHCVSDHLNRLFKQELEILIQIRHDNIVKLLGYCDDEQEGGALVFEFVSNGSLQDKLHDEVAEREIIPWQRRMVIAFQLAQAIEYPHEKHTPQIVHGDIKASNILLDENLNCKLCDFGLAKKGFSSTVMQPSSRSKQVMMGSLGYTDPLYLRTGIASKKNDVYSYGVVLLELVTGMEAFCEERGQLTSIMGPLLRECDCDCEASKVSEIVDPRLAGEFDLKEARALLSLSALCIGHSPIHRPSATQILQVIKDNICSISFLFSSDKDVPIPNPNVCK